MPTNSQNCHMRNFLIYISIYAVTLWFSISYIKGAAEIGTVETLISVTPIIPILLATRSLLKSISNMDEMQKRVNQEAMTTSAIIVGVLSFAYSFLENVGFPEIKILWVLPALIFVWSVAKIQIYKRLS